MHQLRCFFKKINWQVIAEFIAFFGFALFLIYFVYSNKYLQYISPRTKSYFYFTIIVMLIWGVTRLKDLFVLQYKIQPLICLVLIIPVLFTFLPHNSLSSVDFSTNYLKNDIVVANNYLGDAQKQYLKKKEPNKNAYTNNMIKSTKMLNANLTGIDFDTKTIEVKNAEFLEWVIEITDNTTFYEGYTISITGFVFKGNEFNNFSADQFVPARMVMYCCVSDMSPTGIKSIYNQTNMLQLDDWVRVTGKIEITFNEETGEYLPIIQVTKVSATEAPLVPYIYPNLY